MVQILGDAFVSGDRYSVLRNQHFTAAVGQCSKMCVVPLSALCPTNSADFKIADLAVDPDLIMIDGVDIRAELVST